MQLQKKNITGMVFSGFYFTKKINRYKLGRNTKLSHQAQHTVDVNHGKLFRFKIPVYIPVSVDDVTFHISTHLPGKLCRLRAKTYSNSLTITTVKNKQ